MPSTFFDNPILNSPYSDPDRHWNLGTEGQLTNEIVEKRRQSELNTPVHKPKKPTPCGPIGFAGVNKLGTPGRWVFADFTVVFEIADAFTTIINRLKGKGAA